MRAYVERNSIALLSASTQAPAVDPASPCWLGRWCPVPQVSESGLWNQRHVEDAVDVRFLDVLEGIVESRSDERTP